MFVAFETLMASVRSQLLATMKLNLVNSRGWWQSLRRKSSVKFFCPSLLLVDRWFILQLFLLLLTPFKMKLEIWPFGVVNGTRKVLKNSLAMKIGKWEKSSCIHSLFEKICTTMLLCCSRRSPSKSSHTLTQSVFLSILSKALDALPLVGAKINLDFKEVIKHFWRRLNFLWLATKDAKNDWDQLVSEKILYLMMVSDVLVSGFSDHFVSDHWSSTD